MRRSGSEEIGSPPAFRYERGRVFSSKRQTKETCVSLVNFRAEALGYKNAKARPVAFAGRSDWLFRPGYSFLPTQASILSRTPYAPVASI